MKTQIWTMLSKKVSDRLVIATIFFCMLPMAFASLAQSQVVNSSQNARQIALLHWYHANQTAAFVIGGGATGMVFDGANMWTSWYVPDLPDKVSGFVSKMHTSDGATLGSFGVGDDVDWVTAGLAFDGANIWERTPTVTSSKFGRATGRSSATLVSQSARRPWPLTDPTYGHRTVWTW